MASTTRLGSSAACSPKSSRQSCSGVPPSDGVGSTSRKYARTAPVDVTSRCQSTKAPANAAASPGAASKLRSVPRRLSRQLVRARRCGARPISDLTPASTNASVAAASCDASAAAESPASTPGAATTAARSHPASAPVTTGRHSASASPSPPVTTAGSTRPRLAKSSANSARPLSSRRSAPKDATADSSSCSGVPVSPLRADSSSWSAVSGSIRRVGTRQIVGGPSAAAGASLPRAARAARSSGEHAGPRAVPGSGISAGPGGSAIVSSARILASSSAASAKGWVWTRGRRPGRRGTSCGAVASSAQRVRWPPAGAAVHPPWITITTFFSPCSVVDGRDHDHGEAVGNIVAAAMQSAAVPRDRHRPNLCTSQTERRECAESTPHRLTREASLDRGFQIVRDRCGCSFPSSAVPLAQPALGYAGGRGQRTGRPPSR